MEDNISRDEQLLDYLDGSLGEAEANRLETELRSSPSLLARLEELRIIHATLKNNARLESPSRNFTERVMSHLDSFQAPSLSPKNGILLICGVIVAMGLALMMLKAGTFNFTETIPLDSLPVKKEWIRTPAIPFNGKLVMNIILIVATGISFVVLDRTVLRPMFRARITN